jgi:hypothetical protein
MARRKSALELRALAEIKDKQAAARKAAALANPKPYKPRNPTDFQTVYYRDPLEAGRILKFEVKKQALTNLGGADDAGLLLVVPENAVVTEINKGSNLPIVRLRWYFGDASPEVKTTAYGTRWIKKYDQQGGQSHWSVPYSVKEGAFTLNTILTRFNTQFNNTNGTKLATVLGANGYAELVMGYGNQYTVLDTSK